MTTMPNQPPRRDDKVTGPLRRAFRSADPDPDIPDGFADLLARMRGGGSGRDADRAADAK